MRPGDRVLYHGRLVEVLEVGKARAPISGDVVDLVRVKDPLRGTRGMFRAQLEAGELRPPEPRTPAATRGEEGFVR